MTAAVAPAAQTHREQVLRAMGVTVYRLRDATSAAAADAPAGVVPAPVHATCVLVLPAGCTPRQLDLVGRAMTAFGAAFARAPRIEVVDGEVAVAVPVATAYLAFGEAQARALGRVLPAAAMAAAQVALLDVPARLSDAAGKRGLWNAMKALRRSLRAAAAEAAE